MRPFFVVLSLLVFLCSTAQESIVKNIPFKNIGPTIMSGRVVDIDVNPQNPAEFYVGYATGGVWHTVNNGITFESVFDTAPTQNVGDIAINWDENIIWVGTGETISSRSSYAGVGLLKSADGGKTWEQKGLLDSHHISDIILDENNPEVVVVASLGHLYSPNEERGVFKTTDGGDSWSKTLFVSDDAGIISLVAAPENPNVMYAASWDRERAAWNFRGAGVNSGIYKSTDAGDTWQLVTADTAFPQGEGTGRIGLAVVDANTVYAVHDNQNYRDEEEKKDSKKKDELEPEQFQGMTKAEFLALEEAKLKDYLQNKRFPREYDVEKVKELVKNDELKPIDFYKYTYDRNAPDEEGESERAGRRRSILIFEGRGPVPDQVELRRLLCGRRRRHRGVVRRRAPPRPHGAARRAPGLEKAARGAIRDAAVPPSAGPRPILARRREQPSLGPVVCKSSVNRSR